jgi:hypothetical protein
MLTTTQIHRSVCLQDCKRLTRSQGKVLVTVVDSHRRTTPIKVQRVGTGQDLNVQNLSTGLQSKDKTRVSTICQHYMSALYVSTICQHYMSALYVSTICQHYASVLMHYIASKVHSPKTTTPETIVSQLTSAGDRNKS